jgi:hypothetical protein
MKKKLYYLSALLFVLWLLGFFVVGFSSAVHTVLWVAAIILVRSLLICNKPADVVLQKNK